MNFNFPVLVIDDDRLARLDLISMLRSLPDIGPIHEAHSLDAAVRLIPQARVLFVDVHLDRECGFDLLSRLPAEERRAVIFTTGHAAHAVRAFEVEATDFLLKPVPKDGLARAWRRATTSLTATPNPFGSGISSDLSDREAEVLRWLARGKSNPEIASILSIERGTVKRHLENIYAKLGVENRHAALLHALERGYTT